MSLLLAANLLMIATRSPEMDSPMSIFMTFAWPVMGVVAAVALVHAIVQRRRAIRDAPPLSEIRQRRVADVGRSRD